MYLNYAKIKSGQRKQPMLRLRTLAGKELGPIPYVHDLNFAINYAELSTISFMIPYQVNGMLNPLYAAVSSFKVVYTEEFGIYVLTSPSKEGNGVSEIKTVTGYSLEYLFQKKNLFLEEGTYNFWNPVNSADTILGRILELDRTWHVGYVAPRLIGCYRTFDQYDSDALGFCYEDAMEKYRCAIVFDVYDKSINVYDANENPETLPIYLNYNNLVDTVSVEEIPEEMVTKLHLYGSDGLSVRDVNPTGTDYLVDLSYFLYNGDLDIKVGNSNITLADRVRGWQLEIAENQQYYTGLAASRASLTAQKLMAESDLVELNGEMESLVAQQSVTIQAFSLETTARGQQTQQANLDRINSQIAAKQNEIDTQQAKINSLQAEIDSYMNDIKRLTGRLAFSSYFTQEEQKILNQYFIESTVEEETFVATDVDTSAAGAISKVSGTVSINASNIARVELSQFAKTMYTLAGGTVAIGNAGISAEIVRGTLDVKGDSSYVLTAYLGNTNYNNRKFSSGLLTINGRLSRFSSDISVRTEQGITEYKGTRLSFSTSNADSYFTVNVSEFQQYSVAMELYDFGTDVLSDYAWPVYEFSVDSANFLYHEKFEPFKNMLELGKAVYLELGSEGLVKPKIIGFELNFEKINEFKLVFSNRYRLRNGAESWIEDIRNSTRSSRSFDASKYIYNRTADKATEIDIFMNDLQKGAVDAVLSAKNQTVVFNGSGIHVGGDSKYQMRIIDNMIAMTDDGWKTAKLAIGRFASPETGVQWGVNAELIAGKLIIGNNLVLQNPLIDENGNVTGTMMFQVDSTGAWLYNSRIVLQSNNGLIIVDPDYGIVAGTKLLFNTNGTTVTPEFLDKAGSITYDSEGMPTNANFYLDVNTGNAYFRGKLIAKSGTIGGFTIADSYLYSGAGNTRVAINGGTSYYSEYALWAGAGNPSIAPFWVKKNGDFHAKNGDFSGTLSVAKLSGSLTALAGAEIIGPAIYVPNKSNPKFKVDSSGNVSMTGNLTLSNGAIKWSNLNYSVQETINGAYDAAADAAEDAAAAARDASDAEKLARRIANGEFNNGTFINGTEIYSPTIYADEFIVKPKNAAGYSKWTGGYSMYGYFGNYLYKMLSISYIDTGFGPEVEFWSPDGAYAYWAFPRTTFSGYLNFQNAHIEGLSLEATFG